MQAVFSDRSTSAQFPTAVAANCCCSCSPTAALCCILQPGVAVYSVPSHKRRIVGKNFYLGRPFMQVGEESLTF